MTKKNAEEQQVVETKPIPDGGYGWVVVIASFMISFILDGIMYSFSLILVEIQQHFEANDSVANMITGYNTGFLFCSGPIVAGLTKTFGCRSVIMVGAVITSILYFLSALAPSIIYIQIFYGVFGGISTGCTYISSLIVIAEYFDSKIGIATGIVMAGSGVGSTLIPDGLQFVIDDYDWKFTLSLCASCILICCGLGALLTPLNSTSTKPTPKNKPVNKTMTDEQLEGTVNGDNKIVQTYMGSVYSLNTKKLPFYQRNTFLRLIVEVFGEMANFSLLWQNTCFLFIVLSNFFLFTGFFLTYIYLPQVARLNQMRNPQKLLATIGFLNVPFRMLFGLISDRRWITPLNLNTLSVLIATVPYFLYESILQYHTWGQYLFSIQFAVGTAGMNSLTTAYLIDVVGLERFGNATGIVNLFRGIGCFIGPKLGGIISDTLDSKSKVFYFCGMCYVVGLFFTALASFWKIIQDKCFKKKNTEEFDMNNNKITVDEDGDKKLSKTLLKDQSTVYA